MKKILARHFLSAIFLLIFSFCLVGPTLADQGLPPLPASTTGALSGGVKDSIKNQAQSAGAGAGFNMTLGVDDIVSTVIGVVLSLLGIIFLVLIVISGYQWMTAGGNEDQIKSAQKRMVNAIIGLVIVLAAWAITVFVFSRLPLGNGGVNQGGITGS